MLKIGVITVEIRGTYIPQAPAIFLALPDLLTTPALLLALIVALIGAALVTFADGRVDYEEDGEDSKEEYVGDGELHVDGDEYCWWVIL